jgi:DNA-binding winged helix-turn-helix (wHTH) protein
MRYVFGDCTLDTESYVVQRAAQTIPLRPKVFQVLYYLLLHRHRVISKQELQEHIWPAQFVSDAALEGVLKAVRQAVGDSRRRQWCIATRRGQGYRFVAPLVEPVETPRAEPPPPSAPWEQKPVVVLAIDLTFPTDPPSVSLPYDPWTVAQHWQQAIREEVHGVGGMLMPRAGPLLLAAFGLLQTLEQQPQRAVQAALAIRQLVATAQAATGQAPIPALRQALHLGPLLVQGHTDTLPAPVPVGGGNTGGAGASARACGAGGSAGIRPGGAPGHRLVCAGGV